MDCSPPGSSFHGILKNFVVGSHSLVQGIFPTQGLNRISCIVGGFFTFWATKEAQNAHMDPLILYKIVRKAKALSELQNLQVF